MISIWLILLLAQEVRFDSGTVIVPACPAEVYFEDARRPLLGDCENGRFTPRFPLLGGRRYRVGSTSFIVPHSNTQAPRVESVYPSASDLPANLLRFYIHFTEPTQDPEITLETEDGKAVEQAFLEMPEGLWTPDRTRLTVFLHPGRIKRGLQLNERIGPPLQPGLRYQLRVNGAIVKRFRAVDAVRSLPRLHIQASPSKVEVTSDRPLDRALMIRTLQITTAGNGSVEIDQQEKQWRFIPRQPLKPGTYALQAAAELEDISGNRLTRLFDEESSAEAKPVRLAFRVE